MYRSLSWLQPEALWRVDVSSYLAGVISSSSRVSPGIRAA